jgi:hypothetical protein
MTIVETPTRQQNFPERQPGSEMSPERTPHMRYVELNDIE